jgi:hypothetical protein
MQKINKSLKTLDSEPLRRRTEIHTTPVDFETIKKRSINHENEIHKNIQVLSAEDQNLLLNNFKNMFFSMNSNV